MPKQTIQSSYQSLYTSIESALKSGLIAAQKAVEYQRVKTYWTIGREILRAVKQSKGELTINAALLR